MNTCSKSTQRGFTLIEIMVVVVIIGVLGAIVVPQFMSRPDQAKVTAARTDIQAISTALEMYRLDTFNYPSTQQGLDAGGEKLEPTGLPEKPAARPLGHALSVRQPRHPFGRLRPVFLRRRWRGRGGGLCSRHR